ncbi:hypothetical protein BU17DRAFT_97376 [Hysterangium stoloniferum]|nr:hypothetical protein BU17DRAFT_97376 [Hysterangium stoloniferum]
MSYRSTSTSKSLGTISAPRQRPSQSSKAGCIVPELILLILTHIRHPRDVLPEPPHILRTLRSIPLVCTAWYNPGIHVLYQRVVFTTRSSNSTKLLIRSIKAHPRLAELIRVLCFPELRFRPCDYYRNERSNIRLRNFATLIALCPNLTSLRLPTNLQNALSPNPVPGVPLLTQQTKSLVSLQLTTNRVTRYSSQFQVHTNASFSFLPIHNSFPSLACLTLANFTICLEPFPAPSRLLFPYLPSLRVLSLSSCLLDTRAATQIFSAVRGTLRSLEMYQSGYLPSLSETAFRILGPTLQSLAIDEYIYEYHVVVDGHAEVARRLPALRTLKLSAEKLSVDELRQVPPMVETLRITALPMCSCAWCTKNEHILDQVNSTTGTAGAGAGAGAEAEAEAAPVMNDRGREMSAALAQTLALPNFEAKNLTRIILSGRCCAWHVLLDLLEERCKERGIELVQELQLGVTMNANNGTPPPPPSNYILYYVPSLFVQAACAASIE